MRAASGERGDNTWRCQHDRAAHVLRPWPAFLQDGCITEHNIQDGSVRIAACVSGTCGAVAEAARQPAAAGTTEHLPNRRCAPTGRISQAFPRSASEWLIAARPWSHASASSGSEADEQPSTELSPTSPAMPLSHSPAIHHAGVYTLRSLAAPQASYSTEHKATEERAGASSSLS